MRVIFVASLLLLNFSSPAQTEKGRGLLTGSINVAYSNVNRGTVAPATTQVPAFDVQLTKGWFVRDHWLFGVSVNARSQWSHTETPGASVSAPGMSFYFRRDYTYGLNAFVRRYWGDQKWRVFAGGGVGGAYSRNDLSSRLRSGQEGSPTYFFSSSASNNRSISLSPFTQLGAMYFVADRLGLEAFSQSTAFPFSFTSFNLGLTLLTGSTATGSLSPTVTGYQTQRGRWIAGGAMQLTGGRYGFRQRSITSGTNTNYSESNARNSSFTISPSLGVFVSDNLLLGVDIPVSIRNNKSVSQFNVALSKETENMIGLQPYLKKYIGLNRLRPFVAGYVGYQWGELRRENRNQPSFSFAIKQRTVAAGGSLGLAYLLRERFILEATVASITANRFMNTPQQADPENRRAEGWTLSAAATLQPNFSLLYVFR
ncbi:hypothetical protein GCM10023189_60120 [Nibrella saemangeumensis]|uniref:Outer membrane protein beta-barrel domain-containing protein n=1 Tax=Nibrella saemangeumensis TaxID=1084526 RepID=A0ABP8NQM0_9BACT